MAKKKYKSTFWNYSNPWAFRIVFWSLFCIIFFVSFLVCFGPIAYKRHCVNKNPVKVKAVIVDKCHDSGGRSMPSIRHYFYEYWYNGTLYHGVFDVVSNTLYGEIGDTVTIRCNKNRPSQSVFDINDPPNKSLEKILGWKEEWIYIRSEQHCD